MFRRLPALLLLLAALAGCSTHGVRAGADAAEAPAPVLLISIDGLGARALGRGNTPHIERIGDEGVRAAWMAPAYPALTFPNHYTLVTGLRPDHHGVVHNTMRDPALGEFRAADAGAVADGRWWSGAEPVWVTAERAGLRTAMWAWPGSAAEIDGIRPSRWRRYDETVGMQARVDEVAAWLSEPPSTRPQLAALYLEMVDQAGHDDGPDSAQAQQAIARVDAAIGALTDTLAARGLLDRINLIVLSDHGMTDVAPAHVVAIEDMVPLEEAVVVSIGQVIGIAPREGQREAVERRLLGQHDHYRCWRKEQLPAQWHYGQHARIPPIVCQLDEGWDAIPAESVPKRRAWHTRGSHGYPPELPSMRAMFVARGPAFRKGTRIAGFDNVDVHPLLLRLLGLPPRPGDGRIDAFLPALQPPQ